MVMEKAGSKGGVHGMSIFFGVEAFKPAPAVGPSAPEPKQPEPKAKPEIVTAADQPKTADDIVADILLKNPGMNAAALVQALKVSGIKFAKIEIEANEADTSSLAPAVLRDEQKKESWAPLWATLFREDAQ
jgi:hypothetical protein